MAFDLDGTLLRGTSVSAYLARRLGHAELLRDLEQQYAAGRISNSAVADATAAAFAGVPLAEIAEHLDVAPWIANIGAVVGHLQAAGNVVLVCTVTWRFAAEYLRRRHGFDAVSGTVMGVRGGILTGWVVRHFDRDDKIGFVREHCVRHGLALADVVAVGDARSDLPLFAVAGHAIALNATADARAAAHDVVDTDDLTDLLPMLGDHPHMGTKSSPVRRDGS